MWQFGTLTGLQHIRQERRRALSIFSNTDFHSQTKPFQARTVVQTVGVDARLGLKESATLDMTVLPPYEHPFNVTGIFKPDEQRVDVDLPAPRQLLAEESDLFEKGGGVEYKPWVSGTYLHWRYTRKPGESVWDGGRSTILNAAKLSARTRGNWRFGVYNALLGPVKAEVQNENTGQRYSTTLQALSDYNFLSAEYLLRNNSYLHLSNAVLLAGPGVNTVMPALDFRLRDRSNTYEISGKAEGSRLEVRNFKTSGYLYELAAARVNTRWGWQIRHFSKSDRYWPYLLANTAQETDNRASQSVAEINYQDFRPRGRLLNRSAALGAAYTWWSPAAGRRYSGFVYGRISALDRRFRQYTLSGEVIPYNRIFRYAQGGSYLNRLVSPNVAARFDIATDSRKPLQGQVQCGGSAGLQGEFPTLDLALGASWVIHRTFTVQARLQERREFQKLQLLSSPTPWVFMRFDTWETVGYLEINWYTSTAFHVFAQVALHTYHIARPEAVALQAGGQLVPVEADLPDSRVDYDELSGGLGCRYNFSGISYLRFQYGVLPKLPGRTQFFDGQGARMQTSLALIYVLGK